MTPPELRPSTAGRAAATLLLAAVTVALGVIVLQTKLELANLRDEDASLRTERDLAVLDSRSAQTQLKARSLVAERMINELARQVRARDDLARFTTFMLLPAGQEATAPVGAAVWDDLRQMGRISIVHLPANAPGREYHIWIIDAADRPNDAGTFVTTVTGSSMSGGFRPLAPPVKRAMRLVISSEMKGQALKVEGEIVLEGSSAE